MNYPMHHPANPRTHERAVNFHLTNARRSKYENTRRSSLMCAAESAEEVAMLTGMEFTVLPGAIKRPVHNDIWR